MKSPRVKEKEVRVQEIQSAAKKVFFENGFKSTTMESIAREAGISKGTIYLYFKNKEELYIALMMPVLEELGKKFLEFESNVLKHRYTTCKKLMNGFFEVHWQTYQYDNDGIRIVQAFQQGDHFSAMSKETLETINSRARMIAHILLRCNLYLDRPRYKG